MRYPSLFAVLGFCAALANAGCATPQGTNDGAWVSTEAGTFWSDNKLPKGFKLTLNLKFSENMLEYHSVNTTNPDKPAPTDYTTSLDGTVSTFKSQERFNQVSVTKLGPDEFQILKMKDGDVIVGEFWTFRPDGKTLVRRGVGKSPQGTSRAYQETFIRN